MPSSWSIYEALAHKAAEDGGVHAT